MIYLIPGEEKTIWLRLKEMMPNGSTASFQFTFTNDMTGESKVFEPTDLAPTKDWSVFALKVDKPEALPNILDLRPGMWSYKIDADSTILETGKVLVEGDNQKVIRKTPDKKTVTFKR